MLAGSALPLAVVSISDGNISTSFTCDPNGNQTSGLGRSIGYTSYNKPSSITQGSGTLFFSHDVDHQRFMQVSPEGTTRTVIGAVLACARADGALSAQEAIAANPAKSRQRSSADILAFQLTIIAVVTDIENPLFG